MGATTEKAFTEMREMALAVEHEQLACMAHLLLVQVFELQGKTEDARREQRALRRRERRVAAEGLASRESLVSWRLGARAASGICSRCSWRRSSSNAGRSRMLRRSDEAMYREKTPAAPAPRGTAVGAA
jgi:hypothetical protein